MTYIKSEHITRTKNIIKGYFKLSDKSRTTFRIDKEYSWRQWGNNKDNLGLSVSRLEHLQRELFDL